MTIKLKSCTGNTKYSLRIVSSKPSTQYKRYNVCIIDTTQNAILKPLIHSGKYDDYHEFYGPVLEEIERILVAPEDENWSLQLVELDLNDVKTEFYPENGGLSVDYIRREPFSAEKKELYDKEYCELKSRILQNTKTLVILGSILESVIDYRSGIAFGVGGFLGVMYLSLLQQDIDMIEKTRNAQSGRLVLVASMLFLILYNNKDIVHADSFVFLSGFLGFFMYKLGVVVSIL